MNPMTKKYRDIQRRLKVLRQVNQGSVSLDRYWWYLGLECRSVFPADTLRYDAS